MSHLSADILRNNANLKSSPAYSRGLTTPKLSARPLKSRNRNAIVVRAALSLPSRQIYDQNQSNNEWQTSSINEFITEKRRDATTSVQSITSSSDDLDSLSEYVCLKTSTGTRLTISSSGRVILFRPTDNTEKEELVVVSQSQLHLPKACRGIRPSISSQHTDSEGRLVEATLQWGPETAPYAILSLKATDKARGEHLWGKDLSKGFTLEFSVSTDHLDCAEIALHLETSGHWFGGGHLIRQLWPVSKAALEIGPWYAFDNGPTGLNNLLGPHWMTSKGLLVVVDPDTPFLHIGMNAPLANDGQGWQPRKWGVGIQNAARELLPLSHDNDRVAKNGADGLLRVQARTSYRDQKIDHPLRDWAGLNKSAMVEDNVPKYTTIKVTMCAADNVSEACLMGLQSLSPPKSLPAPEVICSPIWTTWARYKAKVDQAKVLRYAQEIADRNLSRSVMEIDDRWQTAYGDLTFDPRKFPDPVGMVDQLHDLGFKVTTWVHPFCERKSKAYKEGAALGYFVGTHRPAGTGVRSTEPAFFPWWNTPRVAALDVTNPEAVEWFVGRLQRLQQETGIDGFKFDAGEPCFLPRDPVTYTPLINPAEYTKLYVQRVAGRFASGVSEVRTGHMTQDVAVLTRMGDRFSTWDQANGLRSIIPTLLTSGLLGYPFCLPDMIGGNAYFGAKPDAELMIRWAQVNALMPAMQFSIAPWDLSRDAEKLVASALQMRKKLEGVLLQLADEAAHTLVPICRPLWFLDAGDETTYDIHDQFALGQDVIVAPVVEKGAVRRDVYLTQGVWRDVNDGSTVQGGQWLRDLYAPLDRIPVFVREGAQGVYL